MKLSAFALDYDGTMAVDGVLDLSVRYAIADLRRRGIVVGSAGDQRQWSCA